MIIDDKIRDQKLQYQINREAAKTLALPSHKIDKNDLLIGEEILSFDQIRMIQQAKLTYSPLGKAFEKQIKTIKNQRKKQVETLKALKSEENKQYIKLIDTFFPKDIRTNEIKNEIDEIRKKEGKIKRKDSKYETKKHKYDFQKYETIRSFGDSIHTRKSNIV